MCLEYRRCFLMSKWSLLSWFGHLKPSLHLFLEVFQGMAQWEGYIQKMEGLHNPSGLECPRSLSRNWKMLQQRGMDGIPCLAGRWMRCSSSHSYSEQWLQSDSVSVIYYQLNKNFFLKFTVFKYPQGQSV